MPRPRLFEFHEQPWVPRIIRDSVVEGLYHLVRGRRLLREITGPFLEFIERTGATRLVDLCSGAGGPALVLPEEIALPGRQPPQIVLSDLFPRPKLWEAARRRVPGSVQYWPHPVRATALPDALSQGSPRMLGNALHHFRPEAARAILDDAVAHSPGIFLCEVFPPGLRGFCSMLWPKPWIVAALPFLSSARPLQRILLTLLMPVISSALIWDGAVSSLRMYRAPDLRRLTTPLGDRVEWVYGTFPYRPMGWSTYLYGVHR